MGDDWTVAQWPAFDSGHRFSVALAIIDRFQRDAQPRALFTMAIEAPSSGHGETLGRYIHYQSGRAGLQGILLYGPDMKDTKMAIMSVIDKLGSRSALDQSRGGQAARSRALAHSLYHLDRPCLIGLVHANAASRRALDDFMGALQGCVALAARQPIGLAIIDSPLPRKIHERAQWRLRIKA